MMTYDTDPGVRLSVQIEVLKYWLVLGVVEVHFIQL